MEQSWKEYLILNVSNTKLTMPLHKRQTYWNQLTNLAMLSMIMYRGRNVVFDDFDININVIKIL